MFDRRTLKVLAIMLLAYGVLVVPGFFSSWYRDSPIELLVAIPFLSIYLFNRVGIPGLLQNNGACGWGWCAPTPLGWAFLVAFWILVTWLLAWAIASAGSVGAGKRGE